MVTNPLLLPSSMISETTGNSDLILRLYSSSKSWCATCKTRVDSSVSYRLDEVIEDRERHIFFYEGTSPRKGLVEVVTSVIEAVFTSKEALLKDRTKEASVDRRSSFVRVPSKKFADKTLN